MIKINFNLTFLNIVRLEKFSFTDEIYAKRDYFFYHLFYLKRPIHSFSLDKIVKGDKKWESPPEHLLTGGKNRVHRHGEMVDTWLSKSQEAIRIGSSPIGGREWVTSWTVYCSNDQGSRNRFSFLKNGSTPPPLRSLFPLPALMWIFYSIWPRGGLCMPTRVRT